MTSTSPALLPELPPRHDLPTSASGRNAQARRLFHDARDADPTTRAELHGQIVLLHLDVARTIATTYAGRGIATDDLVQAANEGLLKAVGRFDVTRSHDFLSFAVPTMRGQVRRYFRDNGWMIRPPRSIQELQIARRKMYDDLHQELGREPTVEELAARLDTTTDVVREAARADGAFTPTSLDQPASDEDGATDIGQLLTDDGSSLEAAEARLLLAPVLRRLSDRDRRVLFLRFFSERTQQEIGAEIGVSQMQVSRTLSRLLTQLRRELEPLTGTLVPG